MHLITLDMGVMALSTNLKYIVLLKLLKRSNSRPSTTPILPSSPAAGRGHTSAHISHQVIPNHLPWKCPTPAAHHRNLRKQRNMPTVWPFQTSVKSDFLRLCLRNFFKKHSQGCKALTSVLEHHSAMVSFTLLPTP